MLRALCLVAFVVAALEQSVAKDAGLRSFKEKLFRRTGAPTLDTTKYYTYEEIIGYLDGLGKAYANRVELKDAGKSYENRTLKTITITNGDGRKDKNVIFIDAAFHAREWLAPAAALYAIEQLVVNYEQNAELLKDYDWVILPLVNPDGYTFSRTTYNMWRKTRKPTANSCYGTDLNRNFDFHWRELGSSSNPCEPQTFAGFEPFSESESRTVRDILHELVDSGRGKMYITVHSFAQAILYPWGYDEAVPEKVDELHEVAQAGSEAIFAATGSPFEAKLSYELSSIGGASDDYAYCIGFPLSFTLELGGDTFFPPINSIKRLVEESWAGIRGMAVKAIEKNPLQHDMLRLKGNGIANEKAVKCRNH